MGPTLRASLRAAYRGPLKLMHYRKGAMPPHLCRRRTPVVAVVTRDHTTSSVPSRVAARAANPARILLARRKTLRQDAAVTDVLVVDDEPSVVEMIAEVLSDEGFAVASAFDGDMALSLIEDGLRPALVVADVMMPRVSGVELAAALRARQGRGAPPVVLMSANHRRLDNIEGVVAKLPKPFSLDAVVHLANEYARG
jgi:two-component system alkaline phosphatase synthesis response regulator PhoP